MVFGGVTVAWTPSMVTAKVSGLTSMFGTKLLRTICSLVKTRV